MGNEKKFFGYKAAIGAFLIIETYHGLTTSKPLQLRCFQSG